MKTIYTVIFFSIVFCEQIHNQINNSKNYFFKSGKLKQLSDELEIDVRNYLLNI